MAKKAREITADEQNAYEQIRLARKVSEFVDYCRETRKTTTHKVVRDSFDKRDYDTFVHEFVRKSAVKFITPAFNEQYKAGANLQTA